MEGNSKGEKEMTYIPDSEEVLYPWELAELQERDMELAEELAEIKYERHRDELLEREFNKEV